MVKHKILNNLETLQRSYDKPKSSLRIVPEDNSQYLDDISKCTDEILARDPEKERIAHVKNILTQVLPLSKYLHKYVI